MKKPNIFICGPSGSGKSTSLRNLNPERTFILNVEQKVLPFRSAHLFKRQRMINSLTDFQIYFKKALETEDIDYIIVESFTALSEMILLQAKKTKIGYDVYGWYADEVFKILFQSKNTDKYVVFVGIDDLIVEESGEGVRMVKVDGQRLRGTIEKEFVIVLHTFAKQNDKNQMEYYYLTNSDGKRSAKSPMEMLPYNMLNDLAEVIKLSEEYYQTTEIELKE